ncbi:MAG TPA: glycosyltransferase family 1 protein [Moorella mulderi]|nr:glycosyltransferase family 1 protein [Moorella mulderi]
MRIAMIHWAFPPIIGGVESHLALLCPFLQKQGHQVALLTGSAPGAPAQENYQEVMVKRSPLLDLNGLTPEEIEAREGEIRNLLEDFLLFWKPEVVHAHNLHYFSFVHAHHLQEICRKHGWPLILTAHNVWQDHVWHRMNSLAGGWDHVIAVSHYIRQELIYNGYPLDRITVVHHGIDTVYFRPPAKGEREALWEAYPAWKGRRVVFHPARMSLAKGCDVSIRALALVREEFPDVLLVMAGHTKTVDWEAKQSKEVALLRQLIADLDLEDHVYIHFFPWQEMPRAYRAAEICIYPSVSQEPFGVVMLEAMATARPIIVSRCGGMPEVILPGYNGFLVDPRDHQDLARWILFLLRCPEVGEAVGNTGRRLMEEKYTVAMMVRNTLAVYRKVLTASRAAVEN